MTQSVDGNAICGPMPIPSSSQFFSPAKFLPLSTPVLPKPQAALTLSSPLSLSLSAAGQRAFLLPLLASVSALNRFPTDVYVTTYKQQGKSVTRSRIFPVRGVICDLLSRKGEIDVDPPLLSPSASPPSFQSFLRCLCRRRAAADEVTLGTANSFRSTKV